jgi:hypothetical protein
MDQDVLTAQLERMDTLRHALGQLQDTPLGDAAIAGRRQPRLTDLEDAINGEPPEAA